MAKTTKKELRVELTAGIAGFKKGFAESEKIAQKWSKSLGEGLGSIASPLGAAQYGAQMLTAGLTAGLAAVTAAAVAAGAGIAYATKATIDYASAIDDLSARSGHSATWLQEMKFAAGQAGLALEDVTSASTKLRKALGEGSADTVKYVQALGLSMEELKNSSPDEQMNKVFRSISALQDPVTKTTIALALMGRGSVGMIQLADGADKLREKSHALGVVMSDENVAAADKLGDEIRALSDAYDGTVRAVGSVITSNASLHELVNGMADIFGTLTGKVNDNRDGLQKLVSEGVLLFAKGLVALADVMDGALLAASGLRLAWTDLRAAGLAAALGAEKLNLALAYGKMNSEDIEYHKAIIAQINDEIKARANNEDRITAETNARRASIAIAKGQLKALESAVKASYGKQYKSTKMGPTFIPGMDGLEGKADEDARKKALRDAERYNKEMERLAEEETKFAFEQKLRQAELRKEFHEEQLDKATEYGNKLLGRLEREELMREDLIRDEIIKEKALRAQQEADAEAAKVRIDDIVDTLMGLGDLMGSLGFEKLGSQIQGVAGWADDLSKAAEDGLISWGELLSLTASAIDGIKSVFSKPGWEKIADGVGERWGKKITEELSKTIEEDAKEIGDTTAAILKNVASIIEEAGGISGFGFENATAAAHDLFSMIETGKLTVAEAGETFDEVFGELLPEAIDETTGLAKESILELIALDKRFGTNSKQVADFMEAQNSALIKGLEAVSKGAVITEKSAAGVAASVVVAYKQLRAQGVSAREALEQIKPSLDALRTKLEELGIGGGAAFDLLAAESALYSDEVAGPLLEAINGAGDAMAALYNMGQLTQETFAGLTASIADTYAKLEAEGKGGSAALQAIQPDLQRIWELQHQYGYEVDAATQALLDQAEAQGLVGKQYMSAQEKQLDAAERLNQIMEAIAKSMGVDIPAAAQDMADGINDAVNGIKIPDATGTYSYTGSGVPTDELPSYETGTEGLVDFGDGTLAMLHGQEAVIPKESLGGIGGPQINFYSTTQIDPRQNYESARDQARFTSDVTAKKTARQLQLSLEMNLA